MPRFESEGGNGDIAGTTSCISIATRVRSHVSLFWASSPSPSVATRRTRKYHHRLAQDSIETRNVRLRGRRAGMERRRRSVAHGDARTAKVHVTGVFSCPVPVGESPTKTSRSATQIPPSRPPAAPRGSSAPAGASATTSRRPRCPLFARRHSGRRFAVPQSSRGHSPQRAG